jgi:hypothetical protein
MNRLLRHIEDARREAETMEDATPLLARLRRRDEAFLRSVLLGFVPWPACFGQETPRCTG